MVSGWWVLIPTLVIAAAFLVFGNPEKRWPGSWGWAIFFLGVGIMIADGFHTWTAVAIPFLIVGTVLGLTGVLTSSNSPAK